MNKNNTNTIMNGIIATIAIVAICAIICTWLICHSKKDNCTQQNSINVCYQQPAESFVEVQVLDEKFEKFFEEFQSMKTVIMNSISVLVFDTIPDGEKLLTVSEVWDNSQFVESKHKKLAEQKLSKILKKHDGKYSDKLAQICSKIQPLNEVEFHKSLKEKLEDDFTRLKKAYEKLREETIKRAIEIRA